ncbi:hypothetical protein CEXT_123341 [Caerostris extrusa]|uniref:Secreted protein n=1 Tax=Caerostris extrusa TaxID=172846 RepID=A0AAV4W6K6_CAEEX|nr:hypothetical protein CEXT_123341 [Caerostris extrusa]
MNMNVRVTHFRIICLRYILSALLYKAEIISDCEHTGPRPPKTRVSPQDDVHQWRTGVPRGLQQEGLRSHHHQQDQQCLVCVLFFREDDEEQQFLREDDEEQQLVVVVHFQQFSP